MKTAFSIFKAYDVRGIIDVQLTVEVVRQIGQVLGSMAFESGETSFCVGRDGRLSGERLANALMEGITAAGVDVIDIGMVPTPVLYFATVHFGNGTGVAVTGSHNPPDYNGLKMMIGGITLFADQIQGIRARIEKEDWRTAEVPGTIRHEDVCLPISNACCPMCALLVRCVLRSMPATVSPVLWLPNSSSRLAAM